MSLVADYGTSSSESESNTDSESETDDVKPPAVPQPAEKLPGPQFGASNAASVFSNPFRQAEDVKTAILEKHVKMVPTLETTQLINGKKICWNYRKGRCRFGHNCAFAHDSDLQRTGEPDAVEEAQAVAVEKGAKIPGPTAKKKRPGLTQGLVPGKKVMKMFHKQQNSKR